MNPVKTASSPSGAGPQARVEQAFRPASKLLFSMLPAGFSRAESSRFVTGHGFSPAKALPFLIVIPTEGFSPCGGTCFSSRRGREERAA